MYYLTCVLDHRELIIALLAHDINSMLHRDCGQDGEGGRELQGAHLLLLPPVGLSGVILQVFKIVYNLELTL